MGQAMVFTATSVQCNSLSGNSPLLPCLGPDWREDLCGFHRMGAAVEKARLRAAGVYTSLSLTPWELWFSYRDVSAFL